MARSRRPHRPKVRPEKLARIRLAVYERDGYRCQHCGWQPSVPDGYDGSGALCGRVTPTGRRRAWLRVLQLDHIVPYKLGGRFELSNLQALCDLCNVRKGAAIA